ncbi:MAG TPA: MarR family transcriptional regulator [Acetobacteraceae bacterium]|nr:MarR family transcriptional regulator [Acetobacteraceae bacterium]
MPPPQPAPDPLSGYVLEDQVGHLLRRAHQRHVAIFQSAIGADLTPTQFAALVKLVELRRATQNHLGRLTGMDPATIQGVIGRLVARGLVERASDPTDRRMVALVPTAEGVRLALAAVVQGRDITEATLAPLDPAERHQFLALLRRMI